MNSIGTKARIRIAGTPNFAAATSAGSAAASEYAGAVDATPMTTFDANDMAFFFSVCVMSKRSVPSALGKGDRHIIVGDLTGLASRHNKRKPAHNHRGGDNDPKTFHRCGRVSFALRSCARCSCAERAGCGRGFRHENGLRHHERGAAPVSQI